jgi:phage terminase large subunit-like protein
LVEAKARFIERNRLKYYAPYAKQRDFHGNGAQYRERLFMAGNQLGKTVSGAAETAMHLTGLYPDWWTGKRFDRPIRCMAGSESAELTRKGVQRNLLGPPEDRQAWGTGMIPADCLVSHSMRAGVADAVASLAVKHVSGGNSVIQFASYDQGRSKWQADTLDLVWFDEEPPLAVYTEGITRTNATGGMVFTTFTPLLGMSDVVMRFLKEQSQDRAVTFMTIDDVDHYSEEQRRKIVESYPPHEREARTKGIPMLGGGRVFPVTEESIKLDSFTILSHWPRIAGIDFGWDHPTACVWMAWDRDTDTVYVYDVYRQREVTPALVSSAFRKRGDWIPVAWPHDGLQHDKGSGKQLAQQYRDEGVDLLPKHATFEDGSNGLEAGVIMMLDRMKTGRLRVAAHLADWWEEFRMYHREDGKIVKERDDLLSATRYGLMMLRHAITRPTGDDYTTHSYRDEDLD